MQQGPLHELLTITLIAQAVSGLALSYLSPPPFFACGTPACPAISTGNPHPFLRTPAVADSMRLTLARFRRPGALPALLAVLVLALGGLVQPAGAQQLPAAPTGDVREFPFAGTTQSIRIRGREGFVSSGDIAYGVGRTTVTYGEMSISADRMSINLITESIEAEGNVVFQTPREEIRGSRATYDFRRHIGTAWDIEGVSKGIFFRAEWDEEQHGPSFRRVSEDEAVFRGASYTASGFPVPTWKVVAEEIILIPGDRVFLRNAVLWIRGIPVLWLPVYTRSLEERSPWSFEAGYRSRYGGYTRIGYQLDHESLVPDWEEPGKYRTRTSGRLGVRVDLFTQGAVGVGMDYRYKIDFERHIGSLDLYGVRDTVRDVEGEGTDNRYFYRHRHNTMLGRTIFQLNADWMSDPDVYYDFGDPFRGGGVRRGRLPERRMRAAFTYLEQDWLARISAEIKDRITLARYQDYSEIQDDNLNYDPDPDFLTVNDIDPDGISRHRYGRVSEKLEGRVATRLLPLFSTPLYWNVEANAFNNLDAGFNERSRDDDERLYGGDLYGSLSHRTRLSPDNRFTWLNTVGAGVGAYERTSDRIVPSPRTVSAPGVSTAPLTFPDRETAVLGGGHSVSYGDVDPVYVWADYVSRLNARFTENLSGYVKYTHRRGTKDSAGAFYEETGRIEAFEDVYNFPIEKQWIEAMLEYSPLFPSITTHLAGGYNLQSDSDIFANERLWYLGGGAEYENDPGEVRIATSAFWEGRQARDRHNPMDFRYSELATHFSIEYLPRHGRFWMGFDVDGTIPLEDDPAPQPARRRARFDEDRSDVSFRPRIGRQFGPKYDVEVFVDYNTRLDDFKEGGVLVKRDIYDADVLVFAGFRSTTFRDRDRDDDTSRSTPDSRKELDFRVGVKFKAPEEAAGLSAASLVTMRDERRDAIFVE